MHSTEADYGPPGINRLLGEHDARLEVHERDITEIKEALAVIRESQLRMEQTAAFGKGALWLLLKVGTAIGALAYTGTYVYHAWFGH